MFFELEELILKQSDTMDMGIPAWLTLQRLSQIIVQDIGIESGVRDRVPENPL